jgi:hypothetical protein
MRSARKLTKASRAGTVSGNGQSPGCLRHFFPPGSSCAYLTTAAPPMFALKCERLADGTTGEILLAMGFGPSIVFLIVSVVGHERAGRGGIHLIAGSRQNTLAVK